MAVGCLSEDDLLEYVSGTPTPQQIERVVEHVDSCTECRHLLCHAVRDLSIAGRVTMPVGDAGDDAAPRLPIVDKTSYRIAREHARGGIGRVLAAEDLRLRRPVAVKELLSDRADAATRFLREAELTARLQHPSIVPVYEAGYWPDGRPFYAMKMISGRSLGELIEEAKTIDARLALLPHVISVAEAMAYAHAQRVIHRDLKPANIVVGEFGETMVVDWGLGKDLSQGLASDEVVPTQSPDPHRTVEGAILGTPAFMAPEQAAGRAADERSDVYALGAILYTLLAGRPPYEGSDLLRLIEQVTAHAAPRLQQVQPASPPDLVAIVDKAMAADPLQRYAHGGEVARDLKRFQAGQLVSVYRYSVWTLARRWLARHRALAAVTALFLVALAGGGAMAVRRIVAERNRARASRDELILVQAQNAEQQDAATALAWLKRYPREAPQQALARKIALSAVDELPALHVFRRKPDGPSGLTPSFSDDGRRLVGACDESSVCVWDVATGRRLFALASPSGRRVGVTRFAPGNETVLFTTSFPAQLWAWRLGDAGARSLKTVPSDNAERQDVWSVKVTRGGLITISGSREDSFISLATGAETVLTRFERKVVSQFSGDERLLISGGRDGIQAWDLERRTLLHQWPGTGTMFDSDVSRDGRWLALENDKAEIHVYDLHSGDELVMPPDPQMRQNSSMAATLSFAPDSRSLISTGPDNRVRLWDVMQRSVRTLRELPDLPRMAMMLPDGQRVLVSGSDRKIHLLSVDGGVDRVLPCGLASSLRTTKDGRYLAAACDDATTRVWRLPPADERQHLRGAGRTLYSAAYLDGARIISFADDYHAIVWDAEKQAAIDSFAIKDPIYALRGTRDGRYLVVRSSDRFFIYELATHTLRPVAVDGAPSDVEPAPDSRTIASAQLGGRIRLWGLDGQPLAQLSAGRGERSIILAFDASGRWLASGDDSGTVSLWNVPAQRLEKIVGQHHGAVLTLQFSPDGTRLASAGSDKLVGVWDLRGGPSRNLVGHVDTIDSLAFSPDGSVLASGGHDNAIRIWDVASGREIVRLGQAGASGWAFGMQFSPDGAWLLGFSSGIASGTRLWETRGWTLQRALGSGAGGGFAPDGKHLLWFSRDTMHIAAVPARADVPVDADGFRRWLDAQTTATVRPSLLPFAAPISSDQ